MITAATFSKCTFVTIPSITHEILLQFGISETQKIRCWWKSCSMQKVTQIVGVAEGRNQTNTGINFAVGFYLTSDKENISTTSEFQTLCFPKQA